MKLRCLQRQLIWPQTVPPERLRHWVVEQLEQEAPLLRWAITAVINAPNGVRRLQVEAVAEG